MNQKQIKTSTPIPVKDTFDHLHYVPILKWRQGEYQALLRLEPSVRDSVTPLLEIPVETWDFENKAPAKSLDEHLGTFGKRLKAKWGQRRCFVDSCHLDGGAKVSTGEHHLEWVFSLARAEKCVAVPAIGLGCKKAYVTAVRNIVAADQRGLCLRLKAHDFKLDGLQKRIRDLLQIIGVDESVVDLVIDFESILGQTAGNYAKRLSAQLALLPSIQKWRTLTVAGTAFPNAIPSSQYRPAGKANRDEWVGYKLMLGALTKSDRIPTFGDYAVSHPATQQIDPRLIDPLAKIKYTIDDEWFVAVGHKVKETGRDQYVDLCKRIVKATPTVYEGPDYSWGDQYIHECANRVSGTGGSSTWPCVGSNHHMTRVVRDIASLYEL